MTTIEIVGSPLYQWEVGRQIRVTPSPGVRITAVQFAKLGDNEALSVAPSEPSGVIIADIPNILLQDNRSLVVYITDMSEDRIEAFTDKTFTIIGRPKPSDYVCTETEVISYAYLDKRLNALEGEGLANAVAEYLKENPVQAGATAEEAAQIEQNKQNIATLDRTKLAASELPNAVNEALAQAKASGAFDGEPGKDGQPGADGKDGTPGKDGTDGVSATHKWSGTVLTVTSASGTSSADLKGEPGKDGADGKDYVLTEADRQEIAEQAAGMVEVPDVDIPTTLPNPNALTFTGAATGTYDGSAPLTVNIPEGGTGAVSSVNGKTGVVALTAADVNALWMNTTSYASDANSVKSTQITKTNNDTWNLPSEPNNRYGVIMFVAENDEKGNGTQMYWPIDGNCAGRMFVRGHANGTWSAWKKVAYTDEITGGSNVELDTTLTQSGKAADAKAVGDALANVGNPTDEQVETAVNAWLDENGDAALTGGGWRKIATHVWDGNTEYQPLTLDYATGEMTFAEVPNTNHTAITVNTEGIATATDMLALYAKVPAEFFKGDYNLRLGANGGYTYGNNTSIVEGGVNANVDVSAFRFERSGTAPSFTGLNAKRIKLRMMFPGGNVWLSNSCFVFQCTLSNGATASNGYPSGIVTARAMVGTIEQEFSIYDNVLVGTYSNCIWEYKARTNQNQQCTEKKETRPIIWKALPEGVTITGVSFVTGNGNWWPCNGTVVEVYEFVG